jgi:hypothetical protein
LISYTTSLLETMKEAWTHVSQAEGFVSSGQQRCRSWSAFEVWRSAIIDAQRSGQQFHPDITELQQFGFPLARRR